MELWKDETQQKLAVQLFDSFQVFANDIKFTSSMKSD